MPDSWFSRALGVGRAVCVSVTELRGPLLIENAGLLPGTAALALQG